MIRLRRLYGIDGFGRSYSFLASTKARRSHVNGRCLRPPLQPNPERTRRDRRRGYRGRVTWWYAGHDRIEHDPREEGR